MGGGVGCLGGARWAQQGAKGLPTWSGRREDEEGGLSVGEKITPGRRAGGVGGVAGGWRFTRAGRQANEMLTDRPPPRAV